MRLILECNHKAKVTKNSEKKIDKNQKLTYNFLDKKKAPHFGGALNKIETN